MGPRRPRHLAATIVAAALLAAAGDARGRAHAAAASEEPGFAGPGAPRYDAGGALLRPEGYRQWVFVGASLGLSYAAGAPDPGPGAFHNVYVRPESYDTFLRTGRFPDRTVLVLELYEAAEKVAPSRHGRFEGKRIAVEAAVKDTRLVDGWGYFSFGDGSVPAARAFPRGACFECHREHAAVDNVFVQFYPVLRDGGH